MFKMTREIYASPRVQGALKILDADILPLILVENDRNDLHCNIFMMIFQHRMCSVSHFYTKKNHQKKFNIFRVGPKIRVGRDT